MDDTGHGGRAGRECVPVGCVEQLHAVARVEERVAEIFDEIAAGSADARTAALMRERADDARARVAGDAVVMARLLTARPYRAGCTDPTR